MKKQRDKKVSENWDVREGQMKCGPLAGKMIRVAVFVTVHLSPGPTGRARDIYWCTWHRLRLYFTFGGFTFGYWFHLSTQVTINCTCSALNIPLVTWRWPMDQVNSNTGFFTRGAHQLSKSHVLTDKRSICIYCHKDIVNICLVTPFRSQCTWRCEHVNCSRAVRSYNLWTNLVSAFVLSLRQHQFRPQISHRIQVRREVQWLQWTV